MPYERVVAPRPPVSPGKSVKGSDAGQLVSSGPGGTPTGAPEPKRKYRRHPKPDENAPERPPSAYVIFSNKVREEVKEQNLSFTKIAKLVGDRWQKLDPAGKEPYEAQANAAKERYKHPAVQHTRRPMLPRSTHSTLPTSKPSTEVLRSRNVPSSMLSPAALLSPTRHSRCSLTCLVQLKTTHEQSQ